MHDLLPSVTVVDDDDSLRRALSRLLSASGYRVRTFATAQELLDAPPDAQAGCLLLDVRMPSLDGLELQEILVSDAVPPAIVFMSGHADVASSVRAMKRGAVDFLLKPFAEDDLLHAVRRALALDFVGRESKRRRDELARRAATLTPREKEVCQLVVRGLLNKQIAARIGTTEKTVKVHRARAMLKMQANSLAELVRLVDQLNGGGELADVLPSARRLSPPRGTIRVDDGDGWTLDAGAGNQH